MVLNGCWQGESKRRIGDDANCGNMNKSVRGGGQQNGVVLNRGHRMWAEKDDVDTF
jgi:hypothetical protein